MRIWVSVGRDTTAECLAVAAIVCLLFFELLDYDVHRLEALLPCPLVGLDPVVDRFQSRAVEALQAWRPSSRTARRHLDPAPAGARHLGLRGQLRHELVDGALSAGQEIEDPPALGLGHGVERVGGGRCSGHVDIVFRYGNMSSERR
jgi:hypothetical protein